MKKLASIFMALTMLLTGYCQELPKNNEKILKFAERRYKTIMPVGFLTGRHICESLAKKAILKTKYGYRTYYGRGGDGRFGNRVENKKDWLPGDIILFNGFKMKVVDNIDSSWCAKQMYKWEDETGFKWSEESKDKFRKQMYVTVANHVGIVADIQWDGDVYTITFFDQGKGYCFIREASFSSKDNINENFTIRRIE